jgi:alpha-beta hydrolase superfamily lysophospholipase
MFGTAGVPRCPGRRFAIELARRHPWLFLRNLVTGDSVHGYNTPAFARRWFYSATTPESDVVRYAAMLCSESQRSSRELAKTNLVNTDRVKTPLLVLGARLDACVTEAEVQATAKAFGTEAEFFDGMGHNMMLESGWETVAERIDSWLSERGL